MPVKLRFLLMKGRGEARVMSAVMSMVSPELVLVIHALSVASLEAVQVAAYSGGAEQAKAADTASLKA